MPSLLLELFSEEVPARMQGQAGRDLERMARERLSAAALTFDGLRTFAGPRRLTLAVDGLPPAQADRTEEVRGPRANALPQALEGFLRKTGLARDALVERDGVLFAHLARPGRPTPEIVAEIVEAIVRGFPWPKSMTWGPNSQSGGTLRWVRPLQRILCVFDGAVVPFQIDGIRSADLTEGHRFMGADRGVPFAVTGFDDYAAGLRERFVVLDAAERRARIEAGARAVCAAEGLELVPDEGLLDEVAGLAEWPTPILGRMDAAFLDLPPEVIATSMRTHQKYFAVRDPATGALAPRFVVVANIEARDGGAALAAGNARVLSARLNDARFFWEQDRAVPLEARLEKLRGVTFHAKLGTMYERVQRIEALAREIAPLVGADPDLAARAARLCKADLATGMVGEFPELQGVMGGYYARTQLVAEAPFPLEGGRAGDGGGMSAVQGSTDGEARGEPLQLLSAPGQGAAPLPPPAPPLGEGSAPTPADIDVVADAVRDHYKPVGPSDSVPTAPVTVAVALADKLDTLVGFFAIDERPTGSKDPYALRRAALGVIRILLQTRTRVSVGHLVDIWYRCLQAYVRQGVALYVTTPRWSSTLGWEYRNTKSDPFRNSLREFWEGFKDGVAYIVVEDRAVILETQYNRKGPVPPTQTVLFAFQACSALKADIKSFFADRLKVQLRDEGKRHDLVDAVFALGDDDLVRIVARVEALDGFLRTEDGAALLAGYKRAANILRIEEKKDGTTYAPLSLQGGGAGGGGSTADTRDADTPNPGPSPLEGEGGALLAALAVVEAELGPRLAAEDFAGAMEALARLRAPVDAFFDRVLVNDPDPAVRVGRLRLLSAIRAAANRVADFSLVSG